MIVSNEAQKMIKENWKAGRGKPQPNGAHPFIQGYFSYHWGIECKPADDVSLGYTDAWQKQWVRGWLEACEIDNAMMYVQSRGHDD